MTSASKLFPTRRIHFGTRNNAVDDPEFDSSSVEGSSYRRTTADRRHHHLNSHNNRQDLGGCNSPHRHIHRHRLSEHDPDHLEHGISQPPSGSIINSEDFRSIRRWGTTENDRLPGVVLLARERLLERLRGVHISENRSSSRIHHDDFSYSGFLETNNNVLEVMPMSSMTKMLPTGLSQHVLNLLSIQVFKNIEENNETSSASRECSICLEGFEDGDELINLPCMHRFHSCCLFPWVEVCGACPNCRKEIVVTSDKLVS